MRREEVRLDGNGLLCKVRELVCESDIRHMTLKDDDGRPITRPSPWAWSAPW